MFDKTDFAAALLVLSAVVLPGCGGGDSENFQAGATVPVVAGGTPEVPAVAGGTPETPATTGVTPEIPAAPGDTPVARVIKHPGVGVTLSDLATLKAYVDQGRGAMGVRLRASGGQSHVQAQLRRAWPVRESEPRP